MSIGGNEITEGLLSSELWDRFDFHLVSYVKSPMQLRYISSKTSSIRHALRHAVVDLLDKILNNYDTCIENDVSALNNENRLFHSRQYVVNVEKTNTSEFMELQGNDDKLNIEISSLAPTIFYQLREDIGISNEDFRRSFTEHQLKDFTNTGRSGSLMYKTFDELFILKTLREYEARYLIEILRGYQSQFRQRPTLFNRYVGLYSMSLQTSLSVITVYVAVMVNAFTPSLNINEIFDLKGSKINRKIKGYLSTEKFLKLKDMDYMDLYESGIRIPTNIYNKLKLVLSNDAKALRKLNITDYSVILGIKHLDMTQSQMLERQKLSGISALLHATSNLASVIREDSVPSTPTSLRHAEVLPTINSYLRPLQMINEKIDRDLYYSDDPVAYETLPIPGIINNTNKRVYIYLLLIDMLQTFDSFKVLDQAFRKLRDPNRHLEYSVIEPSEYEKRFYQFLLNNVFVDAGDDFPWAEIKASETVANAVDGAVEKVEIEQHFIQSNTDSYVEDEADEDENEDKSFFECRL